MIVVISDINDRTADYFSSFLTDKIENSKIFWHNLLSDGSERSLIFDLIDRGASFFIREPVIANPREHEIIRSLYLFIENSNSICIYPSLTNSNFCKFHHYKRISAACRSITSYVELQTIISNEIPSSFSKCIVKGISNRRSTARVIRKGQYFENEGLPWLIQDHFHGRHTRAHVVDNEVFPITIHSAEDWEDYRDMPDLCGHISEISPEVRQAIQNVVTIEGGRFLGIDIIEHSSRFTILEANPMPGYHSFEQALHTQDKPISHALLNFLENKNDKI